MNVKQRRERIKARLKTSPILFGKTCMPAMFTLSSPPCHYEWESFYLDQNVGLLDIVAPRDSAKSSFFGCIIPLYHHQCEEGKKFIVLVSKTQRHSVNLLRTIKDVLNYSVPYRQLYGYWGMHSARVWREDTIILKDGTTIMALGTGQQIIGLLQGHQRPTLLIVDDPEDMNNTKTSEAMEWNLRWLLQAAIPALDAQKGRAIVIGTPQHQACIVEVLFDMSTWVSRRYASMQEDGTALWPEKKSIKVLLEEKRAYEEIGRVSYWYRERQCEVVGDEDQLFKEKYLQYYDGYVTLDDVGDATLHIKSVESSGESSKFDKNLTFAVNIFMGVDPASSTKQTAKFSTVVPVAVNEADDRFVLPYYRKRARPTELAEAILQWFKRYNPVKTRIETVGYQEMLRDYLRNAVKEYIPGLEIKETPRTSKSSRLESMEPYFYRRKVYLLRNMDELKSELIMYPRSKYNDLLDGLYYAMKGAYKPYTHSKASEDRDEGTAAFDWQVL